MARRGLPATCGMMALNRIGVAGGFGRFVARRHASGVACDSNRAAGGEDQPGESPQEALMIVFHSQAPGSAEIGTGRAPASPTLAMPQCDINNEL